MAIRMATNFPTLFDDVPRTDASPSRHAEDSFAFMNRVDQEFWARVRALIESWFAEYPPEYRAELRGAFRSDKPQQHFAAWWELYLFTMYRRLGYQVEVHPSLKHTSKRPDFRLRKGAEGLYVEARLVHSGIFDETQNRHAMREGALFDLINEAKSPNFHVGLTFERIGTQQPRASEVVRPLAQWLHRLDPDHEAAVLEAGGEPDVLHLAPRDWVLTFEAFPISREHRGKPGRLLEIYPLQAGVINDVEKLREALRRKSGKYSNLDEPTWWRCSACRRAWKTVMSRRRSSAVSRFVTGRTIRAGKRPGFDSAMVSGCGRTTLEAGAFRRFSSLHRSFLGWPPAPSHACGPTLGRSIR